MPWSSQTDPADPADSAFPTSTKLINGLSQDQLETLQEIYLRNRVPQENAKDNYLSYLSRKGNQGKTYSQLRKAMLKLSAERARTDTSQKAAYMREKRKGIFLSFFFGLLSNSLCLTIEKGLQKSPSVPQKTQQKSLSAPHCNDMDDVTPNITDTIPDAMEGIVSVTAAKDTVAPTANTAIVPTTGAKTATQKTKGIAKTFKTPMDGCLTMDYMIRAASEALVALNTMDGVIQANATYNPGIFQTNATYNPGVIQAIVATTNQVTDDNYTDPFFPKVS